jgi:regulator of cell morphogenesis and NO signaling
MTKTRTQQLSLGDLVTENPAAARVLEGFGLDYCCHGDRTVDAACEAMGLDFDAVAAELEAVPPLESEEWSTLEAPALARDIVATHHRYLREELPLIDALAERVLTVHGARHPELAEVRRLVAAVRADLEPHLAKEEKILFPAIEATARGRRDFPFGSIANPIRRMMTEHDAAGELLAQLRDVTDGYRVPDDACASYRSLYERLAAIEDDTHVHIHKENNVLFPAALRLLDS